MKAAPMSRFLMGICVVAAACVLSSSARAELDFEYAKALMDKDEPSFNTDDLIQRLIVKLDTVTATQIDAKLIKATVKRRQAATASAEKRTGLLNEADALYKEILVPDNAKHRLYAIAEKDAATIINDRVNATMKAAKELETSDAPKARQMRADAAAQMEKIAAPYKATVDTAEPEFAKHYKAFQDWKTKNDPNDEGKPIPRDIEEPLGKSFDAWIIADKKYIANKVVQLECYDDNDGAKKTLAETLAAYTQTRIDNEAIGFFPVINAWYNFMQGRIYASVQIADKAADSWNTALSVDTANLGEDLKRQMFTLKKLILHDLIKMKMKGKKYGDVEGIIVEAMIEPNLKTLFEEDAGKELIVDYAQALTLPVTDASGAAEYEKAIKKLREMIEKETKGGAQTVWANQYSRTMAEILDDARTKNVRPRLQADEWYSAAHGFFLMGQQEYKKYDEMKKDSPEKTREIKEQFEKAYLEFQNAVDYFRRAIAKARALDTDLASRLEIEPKAWFEMGLSYMKMEHYYEGVIVCQAMRNTFMPEFRKKWIPDPSKSENRRVYTKAVQEFLADIDKPKDGWVAKAGTNVMYGLEANAKAHNDIWNKKLKLFVLGGDESLFADSGVKDKDYQTAKGMAEEAKALLDQAKTLTDPKIAEDNFSQASAKYVAAAERFAKVPTSSEAYELALYQAGSNYTLAQALWAAYRFPSKNPKNKDEKNPQEIKSAELAKLAVEQFERYRAYVKSNPAKDDEKGKEDKERREKLEGAIVLARPTLLMGAAMGGNADTAQQDWSNVVAAADEYIAYEQRVPQTRSAIDNALLNKFHALIKLGAINFAPKCDPYLAEAEKAMNDLRKMKPNDNKLYSYMLNMLSSRYNIAAFQAEKFIKEGTMKEDSERPYEAKVAELQAVRVDMSDEDKDSVPSLEDYSRLVYLFNRSRMTKRAADMALRLLKTFDPENKNMRIPDDEKTWRPMLARMIGDRDTGVKGVVEYGRDLTKEDRCKKEHAVLVDYMYDTAQGVNATKPEDRPAYDKYNVDMKKAQEKLESLVKNFPDVQTLRMGEKAPDGTEKPYLKIIEEEIDYRRKIEAARDLLSEIALTVADAEDAAGNKEGGDKYRTIAYEQTEILQKLRGETPAMKIKMANIAMTTGKFEDALNNLYEVRNAQERGSPLYFDASKKISEVYRKQKKYLEAADYPLFLVVTAGVNSKLVKDKWPDMEQFLEECYANGVKRPEMKKTDEPKDDKKKDGEKKDGEPKADAPKADAPKADAPKADAPKADKDATPPADEKKE